MSDDGKHYRPVRPAGVWWPVSSFNFEKVTARHFRIVIPAEGPYFRNAYKDGFPLGVVELHSDHRIEDIAGKAMYSTMEDTRASRRLLRRPLCFVNR